MSINQKIMTLFARTPVHVGADNSVGAIDSPVMRERHTRIPIIPGSSLKGVISDLWTEDIEREQKNDKVIFKRKKGSNAERLFGSNTEDASAGQLLIGEAKVLAFPVRSAKGSFAWITCPLVLQRYERDANIKLKIPSVNSDDECYGSEEILFKGEKVILEEYCFSSEDLCENIATHLAGLSGDDIWKTVTSRLVIVSDEIFSYFVEHACQVVTRTRIDDETGTVAEGALFNQEQVPSETMFYAVIGAVDKKIEGKDIDSEDALTQLEDKIANSIIQVGANQTIGLGYCSVTIK